MLKVKLLHPNAKAPTVEHPGEDLGFDLYAAEDVILTTGEPVKVRTGIAVEFSLPWVGGLILDRSSMASKSAVTSAGVIDAGYRGELLVLLTYTRAAVDGNGAFCPVTYEVKAGDKIAQLVPVRSETAQEIRVVNELSAVAKRGHKGFGSSGR